MFGAFVFLDPGKSATGNICRPVITPAGMATHARDEAICKRSGADHQSRDSRGGVGNARKNASQAPR